MAMASDGSSSTGVSPTQLRLFFLKVPAKFLGMESFLAQVLLGSGTRNSKT